MEYVPVVSEWPSPQNRNFFERFSQVRPQSQHRRSPGTDHRDADCRAEDLPRPRAPFVYDSADCAAQALTHPGSTKPFCATPVLALAGLRAALPQKWLGAGSE